MSYLSFRPVRALSDVVPLDSELVCTPLSGRVWVVVVGHHADDVLHELLGAIAVEAMGGTGVDHIALKKRFQSLIQYGSREVVSGYSG